MKPSAQRILKAKRWELSEAFFEQPKPVVTVTAPAGYGKSTLLSEWRKDVVARGSEVVWLVVAEDDRDGDKLTIDLLHAVAPADAQRSQMLLGGAGTKGKRAVIMALLAEIASRSHRTVLFIDDIHWLADSASEPILRLLIANQPRGLGLVLSGRTQESSLVSEALLEGRLTRFASSQLAFDDAEVAALLRQHDVDPRPALVNGIVERTHGWPAVIRLIAMTLQEDPHHQDAFLRGMVDRRQALTEYLSDVLLSRLPERSATFLLRISLLRRFSVSLVAAATGMADARSLLDDLERRALPFSRSGDPALPYALHPLVREFLLARVNREDPVAIAEQSRRALEWMDANRRVDAAIDLSLDVGDIDAAAALIDRYSRMEARNYGRHSTFLYWTNKLPPEHLNRFPKIQCIRVWSLNVVRRYGEADAILHGLEAQVAEQNSRDVLDPSSQRDYVVRAVELERYIQLTLRDQWVGLAPKVRNWIERWPDSDKMDLGIAHVLIGCGLSASSDFEEALHHLRLGQRYWREVKAHYVAAWADMWAVTTLAKQGQVRQALYECDEAVAEVATHLGGQTPAEIMLQAMRGYLLYEMNRIDEAGAALEYGLTALVEQCSVDSLIMGYVALARIQNSQGSQMDALETLAEGEVLGWAHNLPRLAIAVAAERIDLLLRHGEINQALVVWDDLKCSASRKAGREFDNVLRDKASRIEARAALLTNRSARALELIAPALAHAVETRQRRKQVELLLLKAMATQQGDNLHATFAIVQEALDVAMSQGYIRVFADEGPPLQRLLTAYREQRGDALSPASVAYLQQVQKAFGPRSETSSEAGTAPIGQELTTRELKVLRKLQSGLSNRELADVLFITEGTLKWHLRNIYSKLGVVSRLAAVSAARQMGLIAEEGESRKPERASAR
ncbi:ATP/maltotriose-dependent transcriptional regulator MalT [Panacagrimonas perspica]|uniref:ATP/maltotriose-dependent transcriptional regulator MalT n=1 Tax=Panacagrimonas perspica TaxID=381431 RepID=A0A4S3K2L4_9GAMM|nr:LuxR C-terminal-related transcriptional regulator [Panacagrimonas perspica]TDU28960.1 ATP/maltotriose-dependent transcriptional regulator MalT [Panacagrimonas perspica]THD02222.1 ATP-dependent transcriptional regulator [Panacagrimonas perspica]